MESLENYLNCIHSKQISMLYVHFLPYPSLLNAPTTYNVQKRKTVAERFNGHICGNLIGKHFLVC